MSLLNKLTIKNLLLNKKRTIVTIIGIILSTALICAVSTMYTSGIASLIDFETREKGNFHAAFYEVPYDDIAKLTNNRGIEDIYKTQNIGYAYLKESKNEYKPYAFIKAFSKEALNNLSIRLVSGRLPHKEGEIVIPTHLKTNGRVTLNVGDTITLDVGTRVGLDNVFLTQHNPLQKEEEILEKIQDTQQLTYKIVGIIERPATNIEPYDAPGYTFVTILNEENNLANYDIFVRYNEKGSKNYTALTANILGVDKEAFKRFIEGDFNSDEVFDSLIQEVTKAKYQYELNSYLILLENNPLLNSTVSGLSTVIIIVILIIIFTSVFCIRNSFAISITEKTKQYGMLRSIGATKKQIKRNVFYEASILGLIGIPLGILSGIFASYILIIVCNYLLKDFFASETMRLIFSVNWLAIIISVVLGIVTIYLSAFGSARTSSKVSPITSIRNSADIKLSAKKVKGSKLIHKLFGVGGDISYKNLKRNKKKYRTTVISIIVSVAVFIALSSFMNLAFSTVKKEFKDIEYNLELVMDNNDVDNLIEETTKLDDLQEYTINREDVFALHNPQYTDKYLEFYPYASSNEMDGLNVIAVGDHEYRKYIKKLGFNYEDVKDKGLLFTNTVSYHEVDGKQKELHVQEYKYQKGDLLTGAVDDRPLNIEIAGLVKELPFALKNNNGMSSIIVSDEFFNQNFTSSRIYVYYLAKNASKTQDALDEILKDKEYTLNNTEQSKRLMNNIYLLTGIFLYGFIIVIILIGITNIFNTITTNMALRRGEFAMLKSIGMTKKEFNRMIRLESLFMGIKSLFFGSLIGVLLSYLMFRVLSEEGEVYQIPFMPILICFVAVLLLIFIIMKYSINKINKQNTIETIRNENI